MPGTGTQKKRSMGLWSATSIGVGAMIGAGIFALVGIAVELAGQLAYVAFLIAGLVAFFTTYSVSKLAVRFPSKGGRVKFLHEGLGEGVLSGGFNIIMWLGYVIVTSLYARAFGEYGTALLGIDQEGLWLHVFSSGIVILFILVNFLGAAAVGKSELTLVIIKVLVLLMFGALGVSMIELEQLAVSDDIKWDHVLLAAGVIFMSYEGFGLVANTAEDVDKPSKNLPRALFLSVGIVIFIYVLVTVSVLGTLSINEILEAKEYVLAEAAKPVLGETGFIIMGIAALFSTASAINATIYGPVHMVQETAKAGQLPDMLIKPLFGHESGIALLLTGLIILLVSNTLSLEAIAETGSLVFLLIYSVVNAVNLKLYRETNSSRGITVLALIGTTLSFMALFYYLTQRSGLTIYVFLGLLFICFLFEWFFLKGKHQ